MHRTTEQVNLVVAQARANVTAENILETGRKKAIKNSIKCEIQSKLSG